MERAQQATPAAALQRAFLPMVAGAYPHPTATATPTHTPTATKTATSSPQPPATATGSATAAPSSTATPTTPAVDLPDVVLLYAGQKTTAEMGFERVAAYYGLKVAAVDIAAGPLTDEQLRDETGAYFSLAFGDGMRLDGYLEAAEQVVLREAVETGGLDVLVTNLRQTSSLTVQALTGGEISGSVPAADSVKDYAIAGTHPDLTRELSGLTITHESDPDDQALQLAPNRPNTDVIVQAKRDDGQLYAVFARYQAGAGTVYVVSNATGGGLAANPLRDSFEASGSGSVFRQRWFSQLIPLMMAVRHSAADEAWHSPRDYANFTLDDPPLEQSEFDFAGILAEAQAHAFHFTLALPPIRAASYEPAVVGLFKDHPDFMSLVQHGNNHDGYEFYHYAPFGTMLYPPRPYPDQTADIVEGRSRLDAFNLATDVGYAAAMVFPYNISPAPTLLFLKSQNFLATINSANVPLDCTRAGAWDAEMYPAEMSYASFGVIKRYHAQAAPYPFDLFLDRPAWLYEHKEVFEAAGIDWLSPIADHLNGLQGSVEWRSPDYILKHLYHTKRRDDGSVDIRFWTNEVTVSPTGAGQTTYHFEREDAQNTAILAVQLDNQTVPYSHTGGWLRVEAMLDAGAEHTLRITYDPIIP